MSGSLIQLVARGSQDKYLTEEPEITFFRSTHQRHTDFAIEDLRQDFTSGGSYGNTSSCTIDRHGDLLMKATVVLDLPGLATVNTDDSSGEDGTNAYWCNSVGLMAIKSAKLIIGTQTIDELYNHYLNCYEELVGRPGKKLGEMVGKADLVADLRNMSKKAQKLYIPLPFYFSMSTVNALPIVALQFHKVEIKIQWTAVSDLIVGSSPAGYVTQVRTNQTKDDVDADNAIGAAVTVSGSEVSASDIGISMMFQVAILHEMERFRFAEGSFTNLIEQHNQKVTTVIDSATTKVDLPFNHPCSELVWVGLRHDNKALNNHFNYGGEVDTAWADRPHDPITSVQLKLSNSSRWNHNDGNAVPSRYFRTVQPYQHHSNVQDADPKFIYSYSFALHPEKTQPSGSLNFSRIDNANMVINVPSETSAAGMDLHVFAKNWNILRITNGLGGLAFAS